MNVGRMGRLKIADALLFCSREFENICKSIHGKPARSLRISFIKLSRNVTLVTKVVSNYINQV